MIDRANWERFATNSVRNVIIKSLKNGIPTRLKEDILADMYSLRRSGKMRRFDLAQKRIGKKAVVSYTHCTKEYWFPTIRNLLFEDSSSGMLITSDIVSDIWISHYIHHVSYLMSGGTTYVYYLSVS